MNKRVVVGLSGGVDSSVAAWLLKEQGYEVIGIFMKNWHDDSVTLNNECPWIDDSADAMLVAEKIGIPFHVIDFSREYKDRIIDYMFSEYEKGRTPNPDVLCNREIKFDVFLEAAMGLNADYVATGHYCRKNTTMENGKEIHHLLAGKDPNKDQSYFLCQVSAKQLSKALFPIGEMMKSEVRAIAAREGLVTAEKKDSQGLCFVGKISLPDFLQQKLKAKEGNVISVPREMEQFTGRDFRGEEKLHLEELSEPFHYSPGDGMVAGKHDGAHFFTIGQRKGLQIGGQPLPLFVIGTDTQNNIIYTGSGEDHPGLYRKCLKVLSHETHWIREDLALKPGQEMMVKCRIRYRQPLENATLIQQESGLYILFERMQKGITPGQFAAWYQGEELLGSGVIHA
ncbi:MAG: tRNA 2-thiouridine(34) synthase MnmA [Bacteroidota bacterium]